MKKKCLLFCALFLTIFMIAGMTSNAKTKREIKEEYEELFDELENTEDEDLEEWFVKYKKFADTYDPERDTIEYFFDEDEIYLMERVVETETYDADFIQKVNVANVLLNRWQYYYVFSDDITEIITSPNQFDYHRTEISESTIHALYFAFEIRDTTNGSIAFRSDKNVPQHPDWKFEMYDGIHWFYKIREKDDYEK